jgi:hypothetical protein
VGRDVPEGHLVQKVARGGEAAGGGVEMQERVGGGAEQGAAAEELRVECESGGDVVARGAWGRGRRAGGAGGRGGGDRLGNCSVCCYRRVWLLWYQYQFTCLVETYPLTAFG